MILEFMNNILKYNDNKINKFHILNYLIIFIKNFYF